MKAQLFRGDLHYAGVTLHTAASGPVTALDTPLVAPGGPWRDGDWRSASQHSLPARLPRRAGAGQPASAPQRLGLAPGARGATCRAARGGPHAAAAVAHGAGYGVARFDGASERGSASPPGWGRQLACPPGTPIRRCSGAAKQRCRRRRSAMSIAVLPS